MGTRLDQRAPAASVRQWRPGEVFAGVQGLLMGGDDGKLTIAVSLVSP